MGEIEEEKVARLVEELIKKHYGRLLYLTIHGGKKINEVIYTLCKDVVALVELKDFRKAGEIWRYLSPILTKQIINKEED